MEKGKLQRSWVFITFILLGFIQLSSWNGMLNYLSDVRNIVYNLGSAFDYSVRIGFSTTVFLVTLGCLAVKLNNKLVIIICSLSTIILMLILAILLPILPEKPISWIYPIGAILLGIVSALLGVSGYGAASALGEDYAGAVSTGLGLAGILAFALYVLGKMVCFSDSSQGIINSVIFLSALSSILCIVGLISYLLILKIDWVKKKYEDQAAPADIECTTANLKEKKTSESSSSEEPPLQHEYQKIDSEAQEKKSNDNEDNLSTFALYSKALPLILTVFNIYFCSLLVFPGLFPLGYSLSSSNETLLIGIYQIGDFVGRYIPIYFTATYFSSRNIIIGSFIRYIPIILSIIGTLFAKYQFWKSLVWNIFIMATISLSNGWLTTCIFMRVPTLYKNPVHIGKACTLNLLMLLLGISLGQVASFFLSLLILPKATA